MEGTARVSSPGGSLRLPRRLLALRSDERLVAGVRAGDPVAFEALYERHASGVLGFCRHMLGSHEEAEDALQQTFVAAHRALLRDDREISFKAWLYTIARNTSLSILRARRELPEDLVEPPSTAGLVEEVERRRELRQLVLGLQDLPDDQRAALVLTELGDLSHAEVAQVLGCEADAVKGIVFRARAALIERREAWDADCGEIREELSIARGGSLRRGRLRHHLAVCPGCVAYLEEVRRQRSLLAVALPVVPALALKDSVMAATGMGAASAASTIGAGAGAGAGVATGGASTAATGAGTLTGTSALGGAIAKVAVVGALVGGAGVATEAVVDRGGSEPARAPAVEVDPAGGSAAPGSTAARPGAGPAAAAPDAKRRAKRARKAAARRARRAKSPAEPRGLARGLSGERPGLRRGHDGDRRGKPAATGRPAESPRATPQRAAGPAPKAPKRTTEPQAEPKAHPEQAGGPETKPSKSQKPADAEEGG